MKILLVFLSAAMLVLCAVMGIALGKKKISLPYAILLILTAVLALRLLLRIIG